MKLAQHLATSELGEAASSRDIGALGEDTFKTWCTSNGLAASTSRPDRMGWDFFVEFTAEWNPSAPLDRQAPLQKALVQVKSTDIQKPSVSAKLSALKNLVYTDIPAFIVYLDFRNTSLPQRAFLLHIGFPQMHDIILQMRRCEEQGRTDLNRVKMSLSLADASVIDAGGGNIKELLQSCIGPDYAERKRKYRQSCGYNQHSIRAHFQISEDQGEDAFVDLLIGTLPSLRLAGAVIEKKRFDILLENDIDYLSGGILTVEVKPVSRAILTAISENCKRTEMEVDVFAPCIPGLTRQHHKLRLTNSFVELVAHFGRKQATMSFQIDRDARMPIGCLIDALAFGLNLSSERAMLQIDFGLSGKIGPMPAPIEARAFSVWQTIYDFATRLETAIMRNRRGSLYVTSICELQRYLEENSESFALLTRPGIELTFYREQNWPKNLPKNGAIFVPVRMDLGVFHYTAIIKADFQGLSETTEGAMRAIGAYPLVIEETILSESQYCADSLNRRAAELAASHDKNSINISLEI